MWTQIIYCCPSYSRLPRHSTRVSQTLDPPWPCSSVASAGTIAGHLHCVLTVASQQRSFTPDSPCLAQHWILTATTTTSKYLGLQSAVSTLLRAPTTPEKLLLACVRIWQIGGGSGNLHWPARWWYHLRSLGIVKNFITNFDPSLPPRVKGAGVGVSVSQCCPLVTCGHRTALLSNNLSSEARWRLLCHTDSFFQGGNGRNTLPNTE